MLLAWFTGVWWGDVAAGWVAAICLLAFGWGLHGTADRRGGMIDLTGARPTGELDLDWADPRPNR